MNKCPGQDLAFRDPERVTYSIECTNCGTDIEFWFDDRKRTCAACGETVMPDLETLMKYHGCASSCKSARECLGNEEYINLVLREKRSPQEGEAELGKLLGLIPENETEIIDFLADIIRENLRNGSFLLDPETDLEPLKSENPGQYQKITAYLQEYVS